MSVDVIHQDRAVLRTELLRILRGILRDDAATDDLDDNMPIGDQVTMDSMDFLDFVIEIRKHIRVDIPEEDYATLNTIRAFLDFIVGPNVVSHAEFETTAARECSSHSTVEKVVR